MGRFQAADAEVEALRVRFGRRRTELHRCESRAESVENPAATSDAANYLEHINRSDPMHRAEKKKRDWRTRQLFHRNGCTLGCVETYTSAHAPPVHEFRHIQVRSLRRDGTGYKPLQFQTRD